MEGPFQGPPLKRSESAEFMFGNTPHLIFKHIQVNHPASPGSTDREPFDSAASDRQQSVY